MTQNEDAFDHVRLKTIAEMETKLLKHTRISREFEELLLNEQVSRQRRKIMQKNKFALEIATAYTVLSKYAQLCQDAGCLASPSEIDTLARLERGELPEGFHPEMSFYEFHDKYDRLKRDFYRRRKDTLATIYRMRAQAKRRERSRLFAARKKKQEAEPPAGPSP